MGCYTSGCGTADVASWRSVRGRVGDERTRVARRHREKARNVFLAQVLRASILLIFYFLWQTTQNVSVVRQTRARTQMFPSVVVPFFHKLLPATTVDGTAQRMPLTMLLLESDPSQEGSGTKTDSTNGMEQTVASTTMQKDPKGRMMSYVPWQERWSSPGRLRDAGSEILMKRGRSSFSSVPGEQG
jgi:hypothetical protein